MLLKEVIFSDSLEQTDMLDAEVLFFNMLLVFDLQLGRISALRDLKNFRGLGFLRRY